MLSVSVDPALTINLIRVFAALGCIFLSGFLLVYFAFGLRNVLSAIATALPIGLAATLLVTNLLAYILGTPRALTWGVLAVFAIACAVAFARRRLFRPLQPLSWFDGIVFAGAGGLILFLSVVNYAVFTTVDYNMHFWLANTIRFGNFPVMAPGAPTLRAEYHYGADLLAAALAHLGQLDSAIVYFILAPLVAMSLYLTASALSAHVLGSNRLGLLAGLFFSFGGGLPFLAPLARQLYVNWRPPSTAVALDELSDYFHSISPNVHAAFPIYITYPHRLVAWAILLSCVILIAQADNSVRNGAGNKTNWIPRISLGALFATVALTEVTLFVLGLAAWGAYGVYQALHQRNLARIRDFALASVPAILLALFQGGVFTTVLFHSPSGDAGLGSAFTLSLLPQAMHAGALALRYTQPLPWEAFYLTVFGLPLIASPVLSYWAIRYKSITPLVWLIAIGLIGFTVPHFIVHNYSSNLARWMEFGHASLALVLGIGVLTLLARECRRLHALILITVCAALTFGWPLFVSLRNIETARSVAIGQSIDDQWTLSPPLRHSHRVDFLSGRTYPFQMGGEARNFLRALPPTARVLTNLFPEVPLLIRGTAPHKNTKLFSYTNFQFPSPGYFDALYALDQEAMQQFGITHLVVNRKWFQATTPETHTLLEDDRFFSLLFSDEQYQEGDAWHRVYRVLPAFYAAPQGTNQDLLRDLERVVPRGASVYVTPAIPQDLRWALTFALRDRQTAGARMDENHTKIRLAVAEPLPTDRYDYALLIDEPPGERWLNWAFTPQDLPSSWGLHSSQRIWHTLGVGLYALESRDCPQRTIASVPASWQIPAGVPAILNLDCLQSTASGDEVNSSLLLTMLSPHASQIELTIAGQSQTIALESGANRMPLSAGTTAVVVNSVAPVWVRAQRVSQNSAERQAGIPALLVLPEFTDSTLTVNAHFYGERSNPQESKLVWELAKQRRIYGHWWHWSSPDRVAVWPIALAKPPDHETRFSFSLNLSDLETEFAIDGDVISPDRDISLPENPGETYVLYLTLIGAGARAHSLPVAWITYSPHAEPSVLLAPRFILLDGASSDRQQQSLTKLMPVQLGPRTPA